MEATETNGRGTNGRFTPGNHFGVTGGRPAQSNKLEYLSVTEGVVSPERWKRIVERAANDAETGTGREVASAREFLAKYILPLPKQLDVHHSGGVNMPYQPTIEEIKARNQELLAGAEANAEFED